jgi:hypothetical protein
MSASFIIKLGAQARAHIETQGLKPADIRCIPAAAGGPKGLALMGLDRFIFGQWITAPEGLTLVGASIGAWRMAAAAQMNPVAALTELERGYIEDQNYSHKPPPDEVYARIFAAVRNTFADFSVRPGVALRVLTARAVGRLNQDGSRRAFARATLANTASRSRLAGYLKRVVFTAGEASALDALLQNADAFGAQAVRLSPENTHHALMASGTIPVVCAPVTHIEHAPSGWYWDGGLIDYHLHYPYSQMGGLTLYPHFAPSITPGWLDKFLPWRKQGVRGRGADWLANMILIAPSPSLMARLPNGTLPNRNDFYRYGTDHPARIRAWRQAVAECQRFADEVAAWLQRPDLKQTLPL